MSSNPLQQTIEALAKEKGVSQDIIIAALQDAIEAAARKKYKNENMRARFNLDAGQMELVAVKRIVETVADASTEISLQEAQGLYGDEAEVDKYIADPLCGFTATTQLWAELLSAMPRIARPENRARIRKSLPIYLFTGGEDPVNEQSRGCVALAEDYRRIGLKSTSYKVYPRARHETLNELNREEVTAHLLEWLDALVHLLRNQ